MHASAVLVLLWFASATSQSPIQTLPPAQALTVCAGNTDITAAGHCVQVDVCAQTNDRGDRLAMGNWTHRSAAPLRVAKDDLAVKVVNNIDVIGVPRGVDVELCAPDFAVLRTSRDYVCNMGTIVSVRGTCENAVGTCAYRPPAGVQMLRYHFHMSWGCHLAAPPGFFLSVPTVPNQLQSCGAVLYARYTQQCEFVCLSAYNNVGGVCVHQCAAGVQTGVQIACQPHEYADSTCTAGDGSTWVTCKPCDVVVGYGIADFSTRFDRSVSTCEATPCAAGQYGVGGQCRMCAEHFYTDVAGQAVCTQCARGQHLPQVGGTTCVECFASPDLPAVSTACPAGQQRYGRLADIDAYFLDVGVATLPTLSESMMYEFCNRGFACLPCRPGQYERDGLCASCDAGTYQPHFATSACFECSIGHTTARVGSINSDECVCLPGFE